MQPGSLILHQYSQLLKIFNAECLQNNLNASFRCSHCWLSSLSVTLLILTWLMRIIHTVYSWFIHWIQPVSRQWMLKHCIIKWLKVEMSYKLNSNIGLQRNISGQPSLAVMNELPFSRLLLSLSVLYFWTSQQTPWSRTHRRGQLLSWWRNFLFFVESETLLPCSQVWKWPHPEQINSRHTFTTYFFKIHYTLLQVKL